MNELEKLLSRLFDDPKKAIKNFHVSWGPEAYRLSIEERAKQLNDALDAIENGDYEEIDDFLDI